MEKTENLEFDQTTTESNGNSKIEYGIARGNSTIVFIKVGLSGTIFGYENKYLKAARILNKNHSCSVIVSSNPVELGYKTDFAKEMQFVKNYADSCDFQDYQIYFMGHSNGATLGILNAYKFAEIKKLLCINGLLNLMPEILIPGFKNFSGEKMDLVYGSKDPCFETAELYKKEFEGGDHNFSSCIELFSVLPGFFFFGDKVGLKNLR